VVDVGLFHHAQELAGVGRQGLHVAALALGVQRVEGQGGLARAGQARDHHQLVAGDVEIDVLEVVRARAAQLNTVHAGFREERAKTPQYRCDGRAAKRTVAHAACSGRRMDGGCGKSCYHPRRLRGVPICLLQNPMTALERRVVAALALLYSFRMLGLFMALPLLALYAAIWSVRRR
jgi:hypothetical protein